LGWLLHGSFGRRKGNAHDEQSAAELTTVN